MARPHAHLQDSDDVLARYLRNLVRGGGSETRLAGHDVRICASCGERTRFRLDPRGTWYTCSVCGRYA